MQGNSKIIYNSGKLVLGWTHPSYGKIGERVEIEIELRKCTGDFETVDHKKITEYTELTIHGDIWKGRGMLSGGQIIDDYINKPENYKKLLIPSDKLKRIFEIWSEWHLNSLNAACIHQESFSANLNHDEWKRRQAAETAKCPEGYGYGTKWLVRELPEEIIEEVQAFEKCVKKQGKR